METSLLNAAYDLAWDCGLLPTGGGIRSLEAAEAYSTLAGMGDSVELLRARGAPDMSDDALLTTLSNVAVTLRAEWAEVL